ncbi:MAG: hypothetical protein LQ339_006510 [Xanthoria mediterranea]|nr:MAG: hypothetical protein LQ339_006510 [Xanthoria mediterranea]
MDSSSSPAGDPPVYYVGQHESKRQLPISPQTWRKAHDCGYDMLTTPITTPLFHSRVLALLATQLSELKDRPLEHPIPAISSLSATDTAITPCKTISYLIGLASPWVDLSSPDPLVYNISRQVLELELSYAAFCGLNKVVLPGPKLQYGSSHGDGLVQYACAVQELLALNNFMQILIHLPMMYHPDQDGDDVEGSLSPFTRKEYTEEGGRSKHDFLGTWDAWHVVRTLCKYHVRLFVALAIPRHLPAIHAQTRWHSEPLKLLSLTAQTFIPNPKDKPALTKYHQDLIHRYMRLRTPPWILLCDVGPIPGVPDGEAKTPKPPKAKGHDSADALEEPEKFLQALIEVGQNDQRTNQTSIKTKNPTYHLAYIRNLQEKSPPQSFLELFGAGYYHDFLQNPLQPLSHNLESESYEVFERDPVKYDLYESAIRRALTDWVSAGKTASSPSGTIVVAVVGAGRGPLVTRALQASETAGVKIELWAVEKNPNAFVLLQYHNEHTWSNQVHLVQSDMRCWEGPVSTQPSQQQQQQYHSSHPHTLQSQKPPPQPQPQPQQPQQQPPPQLQPHKIDILISELLGSFADNELSPECLDPLTHTCLNPTHGLSIPSRYTSYLTPIAAPKLHADIASRTLTDPTAPNTPYVVMLHAFDYLSTQPPPENPATAAAPIIKEAWSFTHGAGNGASPSSSSSPSSSAFNIQNNNNNKHNTRSARLSFPTPHRGCMHGLAGYFEAVLYAEIELSTHPLRAERKSRGMTSWFPIYFPLKVGGSLTITMRRCTDARKVWYEWIVESFLEPSPSPGVENRDSTNVVGGLMEQQKGRKEKRVRLGVSEVGSSRECGCVM